MRELRFVFRALAKRPALSAIAVLTLGLGIGATTAVFSVVYGVLLKPLPFEAPERLVRFYADSPRTGVEGAGLSAADFLDYRDQLTSFEDVAAFRYFGLSLTGVEKPRELTTVQIYPGMLEVLGTPPALGRSFGPEVADRSDHREVILNHGFWQRQFGGDESLLEQTVSLDGNPYTVIGVMPPDFPFPSDGVEMFAPLGINPESARRTGRFLPVIGRLAEGVSLEEAQAEASAVAARLEAAHPESNEEWTVRLVPLHETAVGSVRPALLLILGAVSLMLLIACVNVGNLLLSRGLDRQQEMALRTALGAGRGGILRLLILESVVLALFGGALGTGLALGGTRLLALFGPDNLPRLEQVAISGPVLLFALGLSIATGLLFGALPAFQGSRVDLAATLKEGGRGGSGGSSGTLRRVLTSAQLGVSMLLLVGAALLLKSFLALVQVDLGFRATELVESQMFVYGQKYPEPETWVRFAEDLTTKVEALPGVTAATVTSSIPLNGIGNFTNEVTIVGRSEAEKDQPNIRLVLPSYFETLGVPLVRGRGFTAEDRSGSPTVALLSSTAKRQFFPDVDPMGQRIRVGDTNPTEVTVVGVVGDTIDGGPGEVPRPVLYIPFAQNPTGSMTVVARTATDPAALIPLLEDQVWAVDPDQPVFRTRTFEERVARVIAQPRFYTYLVSVFSAIALILAAVGLYGVISYSVSQRTRELGVRMALGAARRQVLALVLRQAAWLLAAGVVLGLVAAVLTTRLAESLLYAVSPTDLPTFVLVSAVLLLAGLAACWIPARRAAALDPVEALRDE